MKTLLSRLARLFRRKREATGPEPVLIAPPGTPITVSRGAMLLLLEQRARQALDDDIADLDTMPMPVVRDPHQTAKLPVVDMPTLEMLASCSEFHGEDTEYCPLVLSHLGDTRADDSTLLRLPVLRLPTRLPNAHFRFHESEAPTKAMRVIPWRRRAGANATRVMAVKR